MLAERRRRALGVLWIVVALLAGVGCSNDDGTTASASGTRIECGPVLPAAADAVAAMVGARAAAIGAAQATATDRSVVVTFSARVTQDQAAAVCRAPRFELRPVLDEHPDSLVDGEVAPEHSGVFAAGSSGSLRLGAAVPERGRAVARATTDAPVSGRWGVSLQFSDDVARGLNDMAAACFRRAEPCPLGKLAIVYDRVVLFAGTVQAPSFDAGIQQTFDTQTAAVQFAAILNTGADAELGLVSLR